ncbi:MAG: EAL domain-containing protein [Gammaproteobacteria bacterium]
MQVSRLLVVEDEVLVARDIQARLQRMGYEVVGTVARGEDAVSTALAESPDLILMDINLKGEMDGIEAATQINEVSSVPVIYCTAYSNDEVLERAKITSPFGYVLKPFDNRELEINIEIALFKHQVEQDLAKTKQNLDATLTNVSDGVIAADKTGQVILINAVAESLTDCSGERSKNAMLDEVLVLEAFEPGQPAINLLNPETFVYWKQFSGMRQLLVRPDGTRIPIELSANSLDDGEHLTVVTFRDISQQLNYEETIQQNAFYDGLTELPNRSLFVDRLDSSIKRRKRGRPDHFSVVFVDIDGFAVINEGLGHDVGDQIINEVGKRIAKTIRPDDTVSRFSGDIFALLLDPVDSAPGSIQATQRILDAIQDPIEVGGVHLNITATFGIAVNKGDYQTAEDMLRDANTALHRAKADAQGSYVVFDNAMYEDAVRFIDRKSGMQQALAAGEFEVYYQPIVSAQTGKLVSMEALLRWPHPQDGMISPTEFIPIAESTGLILPLGEFVLRSVCDQVRIWNDMGHDGFRVAVNVSVRQFELDLTDLLQRVLHDSGISPESIALEITEGIAMKNLERNSQMLSELKELGLSISMDDFGTGFSSLSYLKRFPLDTIKIDRSFINEIHESSDDQEITRAIIAMGQSVKLKTLAEGVETDEQLEILRSYGCDYIQGFFYGKPMTANDMTTYLEKQSVS